MNTCCRSVARAAFARSHPRKDGHWPSLRLSIFVKLEQQRQRQRRQQQVATTITSRSARERATPVVVWIEPTAIVLLAIVVVVANVVVVSLVGLIGLGAWEHTDRYEITTSWRMRTRTRII